MGGEGREGACAQQSGFASCQAPESCRESQMGSPSGLTGTVIKVKQPESSNPNQIPARGETKVFWLLLQSLVAVGGIFNGSSYAACGESSPLRKKPSGDPSSTIKFLLDAKLFGDDKFPGLFACTASIKHITQHTASPPGFLQPQQEHVAVAWPRGTRHFCGLLTNTSVAVGSSAQPPACVRFSLRLGGQGQLWPRMSAKLPIIFHAGRGTRWWRQGLTATASCGSQAGTERARAPRQEVSCLSTAGKDFKPLG